jgi:hypothetical protein
MTARRRRAWPALVLPGLLAGALLPVGGCAPAAAPGGAGPAADLEFRCAAESRMAASQGATATDARLRALDTRRECIDAGTAPRPPTREAYGT